MKGTAGREQGKSGGDESCTLQVDLVRWPQHPLGTWNSGNSLRNSTL
jgi:hypothetical protein